MTDLLDRLQSATEGSRELDARIDFACCGGSEADLAYVLTDIDRIANPPHYTTSIDAALTLVSENEGDWPYWEVKSRNPNATFVSPRPPSGARAQIWLDGSTTFFGRAATPALALCIAIIKASESKAEAA